MAKITLEFKQAIGDQDPCTLCVFNTDICIEDEIDFPIEFSECGIMDTGHLLTSNLGILEYSNMPKRRRKSQPGLPRYHYTTTVSNVKNYFQMRMILIQPQVQIPGALRADAKC